MPRSRYDSYDGGASYEDDDVNLKLTPYAEISFLVDRAFGTPGNQYGQSLGVSLTDLQLVDGAVYRHPDKDQLKVFSWEESVGYTPLEGFLDRGHFDPADAPDVLPKTYGDTNISYEFVMCRMPEVVVPDDYAGDDYEPGETIADTVAYEYDDENHEKVQIEADTVTMPNAIMWLGGSQEYGPSSSTKTIGKTLTTLGNDLIVDDSDITNWLADTSQDDILRDDLEGRRIRLFKTIQQSNQSDNSFHSAMLIDDELGERIPVNNNAEGSGTAPADAEEHAPNMANDDVPRQPEATEDSSVEEETDTGGMGDFFDAPEPVNDFVSTAQRLGFDEGNADDMLTDMLTDDNGLTESMVQDFGGRDELVAAATEDR